MRKKHKAVFVKKRPILFSTEMVKAILEDRKTQTRRIINKLLGFGMITEFGKSETHGYDWTFRDKRGNWNDITHERLMECCPWNVDELWVRETFRIFYDECDHPEMPGAGTERWDLGVQYKADGECASIDTFHKIRYPCPENCEVNCEKEYKSCGFSNGWKLSIHMKREYSRIQLRVKDVRVERVREITAGDCWEEGCQGGNVEVVIKEFEELWDSINEKRGYGWNVNPFCWVIEFKRIKP